MLFQEALPLVQQFHHAHNRLADWMHGAETTLQQAEPREESIQALEMDIKGKKRISNESCCGAYTLTIQG